VLGHRTGCLGTEGRMGGGLGAFPLHFLACPAAARDRGIRRRCWGWHDTMGAKAIVGHSNFDLLDLCPTIFL
jgi:hypothetical protein